MAGQWTGHTSRAPLAPPLTLSVPCCVDLVAGSHIYSNNTRIRHDQTVFVCRRLFGAPGGPGSQFSRGDPSGGRYDSGEAYAPSPAYKPKYSKPQHYRVREEDDGGELAARYEDDGSSSFDGTGDYSSHSPFRTPSSQLQAHAVAFSGSPAKDDGQYDSKEQQQQQPHSFGGGYAFEFAGTDNGGAVAEF